jgi:hypothetical protein
MERQGNTPGETYDAFVTALAERLDAIVIDDPLSDESYAKLVLLVS